jgi:high-affinity iron transporter
MFAQVFFIVWRESLEALLVVGVLHSWLARNSSNYGELRYLWGGVAAGLVAAVALSAVFDRLNAILPPEGQDLFQMAIILIAAGLIVHMVFWMRKHGQNLKQQLEAGLSSATSNNHYWGIFILAFVAVMREGSETAVFVQGILSSGGSENSSAFYGIALAILTAAASYIPLQLGMRFLSWRMFFRITESMLLLLACALIVSGAEHLISLGVLPYTDPLWNTAFLLDDMSRFGGVIANLTGYRAMPDMATVAVWFLYWGTLVFAAKRHKTRQLSAHPV